MGSGLLVRGNMVHEYNQKRGHDGGSINRGGDDVDEM